MSKSSDPGTRLAKDNPWYCLATLFGEPDDDADQTAFDADRELAAKNRAAWNRWLAVPLSQSQRGNLVQKGIARHELATLSDEEHRDLRKAFAARTGRGGEGPPEPHKIVDFGGTLFDKCVSFDGFFFPSNSNFAGAIFSRRASFKSALFAGDAYFATAAFHGNSNFESATFSGQAHFECATFSANAYFASVAFASTAQFAGATIFCDVNFASAKFLGAACFWSAEFANNANFESATFADNADFESAKFCGERTTFVNTSFRSNTNFAGARFEAGVPDLRGATIHEATEWHGVTWPLPPANRQRAQDQVYSYERLKQEMERLKKHEDEQFFFRKELRARRRLQPFGSAAWLLNVLYGAASNYGYSVALPIIWLGGLIEIGGTIFTFLPVWHGQRMPVARAAALSFANVFSFLPSSRQTISADMVSGLSGAAVAVGAMQSLIGAALLFLLALAIRSRFRMR